jgi:hypothetical protein
VLPSTFVSVDSVVFSSIFFVTGLDWSVFDEHSVHGKALPLDVLSVTLVVVFVVVDPEPFVVFELVVVLEPPDEGFVVLVPLDLVFVLDDVE